MGFAVMVVGSKLIGCICNLPIIKIKKEKMIKGSIFGSNNLQNQHWLMVFFRGGGECITKQCAAFFFFIETLKLLQISYRSWAI